jgi:hypothetical protein
VSDKGGTLLVYCHSKCSQAAVVDALRVRDLWPASIEGNGNPTERIYCFPLADGRTAEHHRKDGPDGKQMWWSVDGKNGLKEHGLTSASLPLYGAEYLSSLDDGVRVALTEGESSAKALWGLGIAAVGTATGASVLPCDESLAVLSRFEVVEWPDNDDVGLDHMNRIASRLTELGSPSIRVVDWPDAPSHGDAVDAVVQGEDVMVLLDAALPANLTSALREGSSEVRLRAMNAATLRENGLSPDKPPIQYLRILGEEGFIVQGWSHLLSAYPKTGKTQLITQVVSEWCAQGIRVTYYSEEPQGVWEARLARMGSADGLENLEIVSAIGFSATDIKADMQIIDANVVVVDTVRLLRLEDENSNSQINLTLTPLIAVARQRGQTLIFLHHNRKGAGEHGVAASGGHAFLGVVDIALELGRVGDQPRRRTIKGWGRINEVPELVYELGDDGVMQALGAPRDLELKEVVVRVRDVLTDLFQTTSQLRDALGEPKPSHDNISKALIQLATTGEALRDPSMTGGSKPGKTYRWRLSNLTSDDLSLRAEVRLIDTEESTNPGVEDD